MEKDNFFGALDDIYSSTFDLSERGKSIAVTCSPDEPHEALLSPDSVNGKLGDLVNPNSGDMLSPHYAQAMRISLALSSGLSAISLNEQTLDFFPHAIAVLDNVGRVMRWNTKAKQLDDGVAVNDETINIIRKTDKNIFEETVQQVISSRSEDKEQASEILSLLRPSGKRPYIVFLFPVPLSDSHLIHSEPALLVIIADPDENLHPLISAAREIYGLSQREAELSVRLSEGLPLTHAAKTMSIAYETARTMIKRIFKKTGCKNQTDLVRVILTIPK